MEVVWEDDSVISASTAFDPLGVDEPRALKLGVPIGSRLFMPNNLQVGSGQDDGIVARGTPSAWTCSPAAEETASAATDIAKVASLDIVCERNRMNPNVHFFLQRLLRKEWIMDWSRGGVSEGGKAG